VLSIISSYRSPSSFLLVVRALGLYTPGPVRLDSAHCPPALSPLAGDSSGRSGPGDGLQGRHSMLARWGASRRVLV